MIRLASCVAGIVLLLAACAEQPRDPPDLAETTRLEEARRLADAGLDQRAEAAVDQLLADGCTQAPAFHLKASLLARRGAWTDAVPWCDKAIAAAALWADPRQLLAECYLRTDRLAAAASVFTDLDRMYPQWAYGPYGLAIVAAKRGDRDEVDRQTRAALARQADHPTVLRMAAWAAQAANDPAREEAMLLALIAKVPNDGDALLRLGDLAEAQRPSEARRWWTRAVEATGSLAAARKLAATAPPRDP
jgi:tetratricopeptide (TPR) repeat protein